MTNDFLIAIYDGNADIARAPLLADDKQTPLPVSYTHLDVYKRQGVALVMENQQLKGIITDGDVRRALTANGADTVSYTHLDVYKRQHCGTVGLVQFCAQLKVARKSGLARNAEP